MVRWPHYKLYGCRPYITIYKGGHHIVISKAGFVSIITEKDGPIYYS